MLAFSDERFRAISPFVEMGAYEALWERRDTSFKGLAELFRKEPNRLPSDFVDYDKAIRTGEQVHKLILKSGVKNFGVKVHPSTEFPESLRDAAEPLELLYFAGDWDLAFSKAVSVVGTRSPTQEGKARARRLVKLLVEAGYTIASGLAKGIDTVAHTAAIEFNGNTFAVIGTPINQIYPAENRELQLRLIREQLVISQVPVLRYGQQGINGNKLFFPERNKTMSALSLATVIVEAGETSGTLIQAKAALQQGRKLFILDSCFENKNITWPARFQKLGAIRVKNFDDILTNLPPSKDVIDAPES